MPIRYHKFFVFSSLNIVQSNHHAFVQRTDFHVSRTIAVDNPPRLWYAVYVGRPMGCPLFMPRRSKKTARSQPESVWSKIKSPRPFQGPESSEPIGIPQLSPGIERIRNASYAWNDPWLKCLATTQSRVISVNSWYLTSLVNLSFCSLFWHWLPIRLTKLNTLYL